MTRDRETKAQELTVEQLELATGGSIMNTLKLVPIVEGVIIPMVAQQLDEARRFKPTESHLNSAKAMLGELLRWAEALKPLRATA